MQISEVADGGPIRSVGMLMQSKKLQKVIKNFKRQSYCGNIGIEKNILKKKKLIQL